MLARLSLTGDDLKRGLRSRPVSARVVYLKRGFSSILLSRELGRKHGSVPSIQ